MLDIRMVIAIPRTIQARTFSFVSLPDLILLTRTRYGHHPSGLNVDEVWILVIDSYRSYRNVFQQPNVEVPMAANTA